MKVWGNKEKSKPKAACCCIQNISSSQSNMYDMPRIHLTLRNAFIMPKYLRWSVPLYVRFVYFSHRGWLQEELKLGQSPHVFPLEVKGNEYKDDRTDNRHPLLGDGVWCTEHEEWVTFLGLKICQRHQTGDKGWLGYSTVSCVNSLQTWSDDAMIQDAA